MDKAYNKLFHNLPTRTTEYMDRVRRLLRLKCKTEAGSSDFIRKLYEGYF